MITQRTTTLWMLIPLWLITACDDGTSDPGNTAADSGTTGATGGTTGDTATDPPGSSSTDSGSSGSSGPSPASTGEDSTGPDPSSTGMATGTSTGEAGLEIAGEWLEEFAPGEAITHIIDEERWDQLASFGDAIFHVDTYDNPGRWVVAQGDASNDFFPDLYSKFNWAWDGDELFYCAVVFDAATAEDAQAAPDANPDDLDEGCAGFPWSPLVPAR